MNPFLHNLLFFHNVCAGIETLTKTNDNPVTDPTWEPSHKQVPISDSIIDAMLCLQKTVSTKLEPWEFPEMEPPTKEHILAGLRPLTHMY